VGGVTAAVEILGGCPVSRPKKQWGPRKMLNIFWGRGGEKWQNYGFAIKAEP